MAENEFGFDVWFKMEPELVLVAHPSPPCDTIMADQLPASIASSCRVETGIHKVIRRFTTQVHGI